MTSGIGALLQIGERAIFNNSQAIRIVGANIANTNAPGYSRRKPNIVFDRSENIGTEANFGTGSNIENVMRMTDRYLNRELLSRLAATANSEVRTNFWSKVEEFFPMDNREGVISSEVTSFFSALEDLEESPADDSLRQRLIFAGSSLTDSINRTFRGIAGVQREADEQIGFLVEDVNRLSAEIADLNSRISSSEIAGQENLSMRDARDQTLRELAEFIDFDLIDQSDGSVTVALSNGFALVNGSTSRNIEFIDAPSFQPVGGYPPGLDGNPLRHLVFNFGDKTTRSDFDLTHVIAAGTGEIGGLLSLRGTQSVTDTSTFDTQGALLDVAARVESLARHFLERFNEAYMGELGNPAAPAVDLTGANPGPYGLFSGAADTNANNLPDDLSNNVAYALTIGFNISTPEQLAGAWDLDAGAGTQYAPGDASNLHQLIGLRSEVRAYNLGGFTANLKMDSLVDETVSAVGSQASRAQADYDFDRDRETVVSEMQASVSGVSLDEEFAELVQLQRLFEGSARMIRVGQELLESIVALLG